MIEFAHNPVMLEECMDGLNLRSGGVYFDGTLGGGGHSFEILRRTAPDGRLIATDLDDSAIAAAKKRLEPFTGRFSIYKSNFKNFSEALEDAGIDKLNGVILDFGVSSFQLDEVSRGFSYMKDAPLDMRMDDRASLSAYDVVNGYSHGELTRIIRDYGEERYAAKVASAIVREREREPINNTTKLADIIKYAIPAANRREGPHPARRTFQAIRIEVNGELAELDKAIRGAHDLLNPGGVMAVITFHSLEDRIVKQAFKIFEHPCTCDPKAPICTCGKKPTAEILTKKPIVPGADELEYNPRSRSSKLRAIKKL